MLINTLRNFSEPYKSLFLSVTIVGVFVCVVSNAYINNKNSGYIFHVKPVQMSIALTMYKFHRYDLMGYREILNLLNNKMYDNDYQKLKEELKELQIQNKQDLIDRAGGDLGLIYYYYLGFNVFGINMAAVRYTWILLLMLSMLFYIVGFYRRPEHLVFGILLGVVYLFFNDYQTVKLFGYFHQRVSPVMGALPFLHLCLSFSTGYNSKREKICILLQSCLLVFWVIFRINSVVYLFLLLILGVYR